MSAAFALLSLISLILISWIGIYSGQLVLFGIVIPYVATLIFVIGVIYRAVKWSASPVPFRIPTTCGQQKSLNWIKPNKIENPDSLFYVIVRMLLEVLCFRSLFRNARMHLEENKKLVFGQNILLWVGALAFHWTFLFIVVKHLRFFIEPTPFFIVAMQSLDGFFQAGVPAISISSVIFLAALSYLTIRRFFVPQLRYISLTSDYFPLFLLLSIGITGFLMRYTLFRVDIRAVKVFLMALINFKPVVFDGIGTIFYIHLFLVCALLIYFPFSKLMHSGGVFLSPTRNLANNSRIKRHVNPWNYPVKVHTYEEWEEEFKDKIKEVGIPLENEK